MMCLPTCRAEFNTLLQVAYDQGVARAMRLHALLPGRPWTETEIIRDGSKWTWATYWEGANIASGDAKTE